MRIAALYDIHANLPALDAVLRDVRAAGVDLIVVGGDAVPGPMPSETVSRLLALEIPARCIQGNGERDVLAFRAGVESDAVPERFRDTMRWVARQLDDDQARALGRWPATLRLDLPGIGAVLFCHATPASDTAIFTRRTPDERVRRLFAGVDAALVVCGHTHMQFDRTIDRLRVMNAGSVGMPFGKPGAYWLLIGGVVELRRTSYDMSLAAERIRGSAYPQAEEFAAENVLAPPVEDEMLARFAHADELG